MLRGRVSVSEREDVSIFGILRNSSMLFSQISRNLSCRYIQFARSAVGWNHSVVRLTVTHSHTVHSDCSPLTVSQSVTDSEQ